MGNSVASTKHQHFEAGRFDELLAILDLIKAGDVLIKGMVLFARGSLDEFLNFTDEQLGRCVCFAGAPSEEQRALKVGLLVERSLVAFLVHGGLAGADGDPVQQAAVGLETAFTDLEDTQLEYSALIQACLLMHKGFKGDGNKACLGSAVQKLKDLLSPDAASSAGELHYLRQFLGTIVHGLCTLKLFYLTSDTAHLTASRRSARRLAPLLPPHHMLQDLWLEDLRLLEVWTAVGGLRAHHAACNRDPPPVTWATLPEVFVGQPKVLDELQRIFEQRQRNLLPVDRPLVLWFSGASGHGKTYLAQLIADILHHTGGSPQEAGKLIVINCQNLRTAESVNSLVDPPTGIRGSGPLIAGLERQPDAVVLLDELDKSMVTAVETVFLPAFERGGYLQSAKDGRVVRTSKAVFIITSNFGAETIRQDSDRFIAGTEEERLRLEASWRKAIVGKLQQTYTPPFLNRTTANLFLFAPYTEAELEQAVAMELLRWATHVAKASGTLVQWTWSVTEFFAENFDQFHGQKVVSRCAECLNSAINAGHTSNYFLLRMANGTLVADTLQAVVRSTRAPAHVLRAALSVDAVPPDAEVPSGADAILSRLLTGLPALSNDSQPVALPTPPPAPRAEPEPLDAPRRPGEGEARALQPEVERDAAPDAAVAAQRALQAEAEADHLRRRLTAVEGDNEMLQAALLLRDREIEALRETIAALQLSLAAQLVVICGLVWVVSWLLPTKLLLTGLAAVAFAGWALWQHVSWWLLPLLGALRRVLGDQGCVALVFGLVAVLLHRLQSGPARIGCPP